MGLNTIVPDGVYTAECFGDDPAAVLLPGEEALAARAGSGRRAEFATARSCARRALGRLTDEAPAITADPRGAPRWPPGIVGSITHCRGYRAAAVAPRARLAAIGIDAEPNEPLPRRVLDRIALPGERADLHRAPRGDVCLDRVLFCVKESVYKAWYPLTGRFLGFDEARVTLDPVAGRYRVRLRVDAPRVFHSGLSGRFFADDRLIVVATAVLA